MCEHQEKSSGGEERSSAFLWEGKTNAVDGIWIIFVCLFVSKEFLLQLGAGNPLLLLKTWEEQKATDFCQEMTSMVVEEPWSNLQQ